MSRNEERAGEEELSEQELAAVQGGLSIIFPGSPQRPPRAPWHDWLVKWPLSSRPKR